MAAPDTTTQDEQVKTSQDTSRFSPPSGKPFYKNWKFWAGIFCMAAGAALTGTGIGFFLGIGFMSLGAGLVSHSFANHLEAKGWGYRTENPGKIALFRGFAYLGYIGFGVLSAVGLGLGLSSGAVAVKLGVGKVAWTVPNVMGALHITAIASWVFGGILAVIVNRQKSPLFQPRTHVFGSLNSIRVWQRQLKLLEEQQSVLSEEEKARHANILRDAEQAVVVNTSPSPSPSFSPSLLVNTSQSIEAAAMVGKAIRLRAASYSNLLDVKQKQQLAVAMQHDPVSVLDNSANVPGRTFSC